MHIIGSEFVDFDYLSDFELRQICYFLVLVESGNSFTEAAKRVGIKQGPFSQRIQALEAKLGGNNVKVELFDRTTKPTLLTEAGRVFLKEVEFALLHLDRAITQARRASQGEIGHLTLGIHNSATNSVLPAILKQFRQQFPEVEIELREVTNPQEISLLKAYHLDAVFHRSPAPYTGDNDLTGVPLWKESFLAVIPETHRLTQHPQIPLTALANEPLILPHLDILPSYKQILRMCRKAGFEPKVVRTIKATGIVTILSLVAAEIGIAILPSHVRVFQREGIVCRPLESEIMSRQVSLVYRKSDSSIALHKFLEVIREVLNLPNLRANGPSPRHF